jgi:hypothetical protein
MTQTVTRVSQYGIQVDNIDSWINWGKSYNGPRNVNKGDEVTLEINEWQGKKYVKSCSIVKVTNGVGSECHAEARTAPQSNREAIIVRQTALKCASSCIKIDPHCAQEVYDEAEARLFTLAEKMEGWINIR